MQELNSFQTWAMRDDAGEFEGKHRQIIMSSIAEAQNLKWSNSTGLTESNGTSTNDPHKIVRTLLPGYTGNPMDLSVESILEYVYKTHKGDNKKIEALIGNAAEVLAEQHGVQIPMPNDTAVHESNDPDEYFLARLRDRIVNMDMEPLIEKTELYKEYVVEAKLRDINHLEDLVLERGFTGLKQSIEVLRAFAEGKAHAQTTIKWDGSPAIVFGRDEAGEFFLTDKSGYSAKGYDGKAKSAKALGQMFANRKAPMDDSRQKFVNNMMGIFDEFKNATPPDFRGMLAGDLMYTSTPPNLTFKPNVVQYKVNQHSALGKRIAQSKIGIAVHKYIGDQYNSTTEAIKQIQTGEVLIIPPVHISQPSNIGTGPIDKLEAFANKYSKEMQALFDPSGLRGIADVHKLFYKYINSKVDGNLNDLTTHDFLDWLNTETLSDSKRANIIKYIDANKVGTDALWTLIKSVMRLKDRLINEFDAHPTEVQQSTAGQPGGEGYVVKTKQGPVKLVSRSKFTAANRTAHR